MQELKQWKERPVSWSQLNSWKYNKDQWFQSYIMLNRFEPNQQMIFGNTVGDTLGTDDSMVPKLNEHLVGVKEYELKAQMNDHTLIGYCDHYCPKKKVLNENKTSYREDRWDQKTVDEHGQLTMYSLMLMLKEKVKPEELEIWLNFIPVGMKRYGKMYIPDPDVFHRFPTKRTTQDCLMFGGWITQTLKEMEDYATTCLKA